MGTVKELLAKFDEHCDKIMAEADEEKVPQSEIARVRRLLKQFYLFGAMDATILEVHPGELLFTVVRECMIMDTESDPVEEVSNASNS
jgi:hypothetical protein